MRALQSVRLQIQWWWCAFATDKTDAVRPSSPSPSMRAPGVGSADQRISGSAGESAPMEEPRPNKQRPTEATRDHTKHFGRAEARASRGCSCLPRVSSFAGAYKFVYPPVLDRAMNGVNAHPRDLLMPATRSSPICCCLLFVRVYRTMHVHPAIPRCMVRRGECMAASCRDGVPGATTQVLTESY
jgi:hypothetical protein